MSKATRILTVFPSSPLVSARGANLDHVALELVFRVGIGRQDERHRQSGCWGRCGEVRPVVGDAAPILASGSSISSSQFLVGSAISMICVPVVTGRSRRVSCTFQPTTLPLMGLVIFSAFFLVRAGSQTAPAALRPWSPAGSSRFGCRECRPRACGPDRADPCFALAARYACWFVAISPISCARWSSSGELRCTASTSSFATVWPSRTGTNDAAVDRGEHIGAFRAAVCRRPSP